MSRGPFDPLLEDLPGTLPIFPLGGVLLLPRGILPLNIFEPRYLAMTLDALGSPTRLIGMVQPMDPEDRSDGPAVYSVGCAGRITSFGETDDGRLLITLTGVARFRIEGEIEGKDGYRLVRPDWSPYARDLEPETDAGLDRARFIDTLKAYFSLKGIAAKWDAIGATPDERLVHSLSMICPFDPVEKQALLEAPTLPERGKMLQALMEMAVLGQGEDDTLSPQ